MAECAVNGVLIGLGGTFFLAFFLVRLLDMVNLTGAMILKERRVLP
jgi:hypothetical protein